MSDAEHECTSNILYGGSSQRLETGVPLEDMSNNPVNMGSAPPIYAEIQRDPSAKTVGQSEAKAPTARDGTNPPILYQELTLIDK